jgi:hypothetical protein
MHSEVGVRTEKPPFGEEAFAGWLVYPDYPCMAKKNQRPVNRCISINKKCRQIRESRWHNHAIKDITKWKLWKK